MKRTLILILIAVGATAFFMFDLHEYLTLKKMQDVLKDLEVYYEQNPIQAIVLFTSAFIGLTSFMIPGSLPLMLLAGALFGWKLGLLICVFAGAVGGSICFLLSRYIAYDAVRNRLEKTFKEVDRRIEQDGAFFLLLLRIIPGVPTNVISMVMGLTSITLATFITVTTIGIIPWYAIYVIAGTKLRELNAISDILSTDTLMLFGAASMLLIAGYVIKKRYDFTSVTQVEKA